MLKIILFGSITKNMQQSTKLLFTAIFCTLLLNVKAQQSINNYVLYNGNGTIPGATSSVPAAPGYAVQLSSSTTINGNGFIGSSHLISTTGTSVIRAGMYSKGKITLSNSNTVFGNMSAENSVTPSGNGIQTGSNAQITGNINANGNITIGGGSVNGSVTRVAGSTYSGPVPTGGNTIGTPNLPGLPALPTPVVFPAAGTTDITTTTTISPGSYRNMALGGKKTITFNGPGTYVFASVNNSGNTNTFRFNFQNNSTGVFKIYIHGNANLGKSGSTFINGGHASRIFYETHGTGTNAFIIVNGSSSSPSRLDGNIYAPYGAINIGSGTGSTSLSGSLWSGTQVILQSGVTVNYVAPATQCTTPTMNAGPDKVIDCNNSSVTLNGTSTTPGVTYSWAGPGIVSGATSANAVVNAAGTYTLTVNNNGCTATDQAVVTLNTGAPNANAGSSATLTCAASVVSLTASSSTSGATFAWSGPGIVSNSGNASVMVNAAGTYTVVVTNPSNGCTASAQTSVNTNYSVPTAEAGPGNALTCTILEIQLTGSSSVQGATFNWTTSGTGSFVNGANTATPVINGIGTYHLTVTDPASGCTATDSVVIEEGPCILPYYTPCPDGKFNGVLGCELSSLFENYVVGSDTINDVYFFAGDSVYIEIITSQGQTQNLFNLIYNTTGYGLTDTIPNGLNPLIITGRYPIANLDNLSNPPASNYINYVRPVYPSITNSGVTVTQGDIAQRSNQVRDGFGIDGSGVKVCVLSDSYNTILGNPANTDIVNGDLPGTGNPENHPTPVDVIKEFPYGTRSDEGRAMLQLVHDIAPGATLGFRTATISEGDMAEGIIQCAQSGCDVIADDVTWVTSPYFQDGCTGESCRFCKCHGRFLFCCCRQFRF
jgi:hypothetical protein